MDSINIYSKKGKLCIEYKDMVFKSNARVGHIYLDDKAGTIQYMKMPEKKGLRTADNILIAVRWDGIDVLYTYILKDLICINSSMPKDNPNTTFKRRYERLD